MALISPAAGLSPAAEQLADAGLVVVPLASSAYPDARAESLVAVLSCDLAVVALSAAVGLDGPTGLLWEALAAAGMPRAVLVTDLGPGRADFDDLVALAQKVLGEECLPVRLPVFDDDGGLAGTLDLTTVELATASGTRPAEPGHLSVAAADLSALLSVAATTVPDDGAAESYVALLDEVDQRADTAPPAASGAVLLGMPSMPSAPLRLPQRLAQDIADATAEAVVAPVVVASPEGAWLRDLASWAGTADAPDDRLVRRDAEGNPIDGWAAVVLAVSDNEALLRPVYDQPVAGYALITAVGADENGAPVPHRAWPTQLSPLPPAAAPSRPDAQHRTAWWASTVRVSVGDTVSGGHVWLVPVQDQ